MRFRNFATEKLKQNKGVLRTLGLCVAGGLIFLSGLGIGNGTIILNRDQLFRKSVQKNSSDNLDYTSVEEVYDILRRDYDGQLDTAKLLDGLKAGLASAAGDPYTQYLNAEESKSLGEQLSGSFTGIGAELIEKDKFVTIEVPLAGFPAEKAGLKAKDVILQINDKDAYDIGVREAVKLIRGEAGTTVKLKVVRDNNKQLDLEITRTKITIPSVKSEILAGNIGYLKINSRFGEDTPALARAAALSFRDAKVKGVILDMRNNPGGLLEASVELANLWLEPGKPIVQQKRGSTVISEYKSKGSPVLNGIPTIVLINEGSASASEIVAGALRDNNAAKLLGTKTYGKGSVQQLEKLGGGGELKVTIARWFTPLGVNINKEGVKPDVEVKVSEDDIKAAKDPQLDAAKAALQ